MASYRELKIFTDGGSRGNPGIAGIGVHAEDETGATIHDFCVFLGTNTNNVSEYQGLISAITWLREFSAVNKIEKVSFFMDSKLVVEQVNRRWQIKQDHLQELAQEVWQLLQSLYMPYTLTHVRREQNKVADLLANKAMDSQSAGV